MSGGLRHALHSAVKGVAEAVLPARTTSAFDERGVSRGGRVDMRPTVGARARARRGRGVVGAPQ